MENNCGPFGFRTFHNVGNEPWHIQPSNITTGRRFATTLPPLNRWALPDEPPPQPPPKPPVQAGVFTVQGYRSTVRQGTAGKMAKMCQQQINLIGGQGIAEDGQFGAQLVEALKRVQTALGVGADGVCGARTWQAFRERHQGASASGWLGLAVRHAQPFVIELMVLSFTFIIGFFIRRVGRADRGGGSAQPRSRHGHHCQHVGVAGVRYPWRPARVDRWKSTADSELHQRPGGGADDLTRGPPPP